MVDMDSMDECGWAPFSCKCQDAKNNTYSCLRTIATGGAEKDEVYCVFRVCVTTTDFNEENQKGSVRINSFFDISVAYTQYVL